MKFGGIGGYPATVAGEFGKSVPVAGKAVAPAGIGKGIPSAFGKGYPATKAAGLGAKVPAAKVATTPFPGVI